MNITSLIVNCQLSIVHSFVFPPLMRPKPACRITQDALFHQAGILFGDPVFGSLFGSLGHQFHVYGVVAAFDLLGVKEDDGQVEFACQAFGTCQDGGFLVEEGCPVMQVVPARCLVGNEDHDTAYLIPLQLDHVAYGGLFFDPV